MVEKAGEGLKESEMYLYQLLLAYCDIFSSFGKTLAGLE